MVMGKGENSAPKDELRLSFPVVDIEGRQILAAGTAVTPAVLEELAAEGGKWEHLPLLEYGTIRDDIRHQMTLGVYGTIFGDGAIDGSLGELMSQVSFPEPVLEALYYFKGHDYYTYRHILMVFALACLISQRGAIDKNQMFMEASAGPLHDLGKFCVPLEILKKSTPLTRPEKKILEEHSAAGWVLLTYYMKDVESLSARVARDHHERKDGSGYPRGIALSDRHVEIITACDIYDALVTARPYRKENFDNRTALEELTDLASCGKVTWEIVRHLVSLNRQEHPSPDECEVSLERRGVPPAENFYGVFAEDREDEQAESG